MFKKNFIVIIVLLCYCISTISAQSYLSTDTIKKSVYFESDSGTYIFFFSRRTCKNSSIYSKFVKTLSSPPQIIKEKVVEKVILKDKFLTLHGNISYDYLYRSKVDTPLNQQNFQQHTEHIFINALIKNKYPFKIDVSSRQSNSFYFRNFFDCNFKFDRATYQNNLKRELISKLSPGEGELNSLKLAEVELSKNLKKSVELQSWLNSKSVLQKIIQEREQLRDNELKYPGLNGKKSLSVPFDLNSYEKRKFKIDKKDTLQKTDTSYTRKYEKNRKRVDSLRKNIDSLNKKVDSLKTKMQKNEAIAKQLVYGASNEKQLKQIYNRYGIKPDSTDKLEKYISNIKSFDVGRSALNYTELTAKDITISGINVEYDPSCYIAFAVGKIDYRFRDFLDKSRSADGQYVAIGRIGIGEVNKKSLILSIFQGRKNQSEYALADSIKNYINIFGYSVEGVFKKNENTSISAEIAKSTLPVTGNFTANRQYKSLLKFSDETNMGINIKVQTLFPVTDTKISGYFRKTGENFQSFSLFSYNTNQTAWVARADQYFYKKRITLTGMLRENDFTNPFTDKSFKTTTTFKTILLNIRCPKYPSINVGYYPGTQLYFVNKERIRENAYYILNGSVIYGYYLKALGMNSTIVMNRYFNQATDSGFILYKGINYYFSQILFLNRLQLQGGYSYTKQPNLKYYTLESSADFSVNKILKIGIGAKYNRLADSKNYFGGRVLLGILFKPLGTFRLQYEKSYLPTLQQSLYPVEIGRISWSKYF